MQLLLTAKQVAEFLQLSPSQVYGLAASGELPSYKLGGSVRFKEEDVEAWIEKGKRASGNEIESKAKEVLRRGKPMDIDKIVRRAIDSTKDS